MYNLGVTSLQKIGFPNSIFYSNKVGLSVAIFYSAALHKRIFTAIPHTTIRQQQLK
jgi:hypothetical protein